MISIFTRRSLLAAVALVSFATACNKPEPVASSELATPVTVVQVSNDSIVQAITATGTFGPRDEVPLAFKIGGVVARVLVDEGATVQRGQLLAALDPREIDAMVSKARVAVDKAQRDHVRIERLYRDSVATLSQFQDATSALDAARADLTTAQVNREYATIVAPAAGVILKRHIAAGATTAAGTAVLTFGRSDRDRVLRVGLADHDALRVKQGDRASAQFDALPGKTFKGRIALLGRAADSRTGTYIAEISLDGAEALPAGLVGRVSLEPAASAVAMLVPLDALVEANEDSAVIYTASSDEFPKAERHTVKILFLSGDQVAVHTDASANSLRRVITRGAQYLSADTRVRIVSETAEKGAMPEATRKVSASEAHK